jgi:hypothetical protein
LRDALILVLQTSLNTNKPHIGAFVLPQGIWFAKHASETFRKFET